MTCSRNRFLCKSCYSANCTLLSCGKTCGCTSRSYCNNIFFCVSESCNLFLCNKNCVTYGTMLTFCKTCSCASRSYCRINYLCMSKSCNLYFNKRVTYRTLVLFKTLFCTCSFCYCFNENKHVCACCGLNNNSLCFFTYCTCVYSKTFVFTIGLLFDLCHLPIVLCSSKICNNRIAAYFTCYCACCTCSTACRSVNNGSTIAVSVRRNLCGSNCVVASCALLRSSCACFCTCRILCRSYFNDVMAAEICCKAIQKGATAITLINSVTTGSTRRSFCIYCCVVNACVIAMLNRVVINNTGITCSKYRKRHTCTHYECKHE